MDTDYIIFNSHSERNDFISNRIWRHIVSWLVCLILPFIFTFIITCFKFFNDYQDAEYISALSILAVILIFILCIIYYLLKECERLISDLSKTRVSKDATDLY